MTTRASPYDGVKQSLVSVLPMLGLSFSSHAVRAACDVHGNVAQETIREDYAEVRIRRIVDCVAGDDDHRDNANLKMYSAYASTTNARMRC